MSRVSRAKKSRSRSRRKSRRSLRGGVNTKTALAMTTAAGGTAYIFNLLRENDQLKTELRTQKMIADYFLWNKIKDNTDESNIKIMLSKIISAQNDRNENAKREITQRLKALLTRVTTKQKQE